MTARHADIVTGVADVDERYPAVEPYETGMLDVGDGNLVYWETCGNPGSRRWWLRREGPGIT
jgi:proline iminopeptidase